MQFIFYPGKGILWVQGDAQFFGFCISLYFFLRNLGEVYNRNALNKTLYLVINLCNLKCTDSTSFFKLQDCEANFIN